VDCSKCDYIKWVTEDRGEWHGQPTYEEVPVCSLGYDPDDCPYIMNCDDEDWSEDNS
jgi:hypothetical protein